MTFYQSDNTNGWATSSATTYSYSITPGATVVLNGVVPAPAPKTEVERMLGEVEAVCALAR